MIERLEMEITIKSYTSIYSVYCTYRDGEDLRPINRDLPNLV